MKIVILDGVESFDFRKSELRAFEIVASCCRQMSKHLPDKPAEAKDLLETAIAVAEVTELYGPTPSPAATVAPSTSADDDNLE